ncbi:MAG: DUF4245 domain-containing protein [Rhodoglobus sp.]
MARKKPAIVAELGRPETAEETAARKAETSRTHRANQTALNLVGATVASLAIVLFLVVVVVRPAPAPSESLDYAAIAAQAQPNSSEPLLAPVLAPTWNTNDARFETRADIASWYIGFITPSTQFIALNQGIEANVSWQSAILNNAEKTGSTTIDGTKWTVFDQRDSVDPGNFAYAMATTVGASTIVLHGTASTIEFETLASSITSEWRAND